MIPFVLQVVDKFKWPTHANIIRALEDISDRGAFIYICFSPSVVTVCACGRNPCRFLRIFTNPT
jgi:hypothetical protein